MTFRERLEALQREDATVVLGTVSDGLELRWLALTEQRPLMKREPPRIPVEAAVLERLATALANRFRVATSLTPVERSFVLGAANGDQSREVRRRTAWLMASSLEHAHVGQGRVDATPPTRPLWSSLPDEPSGILVEYWYGALWVRLPTVATLEGDWLERLRRVGSVARDVGCEVWFVTTPPEPLPEGTVELGRQRVPWP